MLLQKQGIMDNECINMYPDLPKKTTGKMGKSNVYTLTWVFKKNYLFYFWLHWIFIAACGLSLVMVSRNYSLVVGNGISLSGSFSYCRARSLKHVSFSSCGSWASLPCGMWDHSSYSGNKLISPALTGEFLSTGPPRSPHGSFLRWKWKSFSHVWLFATPWVIESMEFSRPEYWNE